MKTTHASMIGGLLAAVFATVLTGSAFAQDKPTAAKAGRSASETVHVKATVDSVDQATRTVTLTNTSGEKMSFVAGDEVRNLAQLKKGDVVQLDYSQAVAVKLAKTSDTTRSRTVTQATTRSEPGQKPGGTATNTVKVIASIEKIDGKKNLVTLRGPEHTVDVKADPAMLKGVKVGDFVEVTYTEALAISVTAAK